MPSKLAKPDSTAKLEVNGKLDKTAKSVKTSNPIKTFPSMMKTSKLVKSKVPNKGQKSDDQPKVKKARIEAAGSSDTVPLSSNTVPSYDNDDSKDSDVETSSQNGSKSSESGETRKPRKPSESGESDESDDDETPRENEDEVEDIVGRREKGGIVQFRVKWKGYSRAESTWEPIENLSNAQDLVNEFEANRKAEAERKAKKNSFKNSAKGTKNQPGTSGTTKIDSNFVMTGVKSIAPDKHSWVLEYNKATMVPMSQTKVKSLPAKEKAMCVEYLRGYIHEQENELEHAKVMLQQLKE